MTTSVVRRTAYRLFAGLASWTIDDPIAMRTQLEKADIPHRPEMHLAVYYAAAVGLFLLAIGALAVAWALGAHLGILFGIFTLGLVSVGACYGWAFQGPRVHAFMRGERLDEQLPFAVNYMASMAQADVTPEQLIANLSRQPVYGEVTVEAQRIRRDIEALGMDLVTALQRASERAPSARFHDFIQGLLTAIAAGGSHDDYLATKAEQYMDDLTQDQEAFLDNLELLAESDATVIVAGPLFVIIMLTVLVLFGTSGRMPLHLGYIMMLGLVPLANVGFAVAIETMSPGA